MEDENKNKYDFLLSLLSEGDAMICLDARLPEVDVPRDHKDNPSLNLILNLNFRRPLDIEKEGVYVTLAFQGRPHPCVVPFDAVWAIYDPSLKKGQVWDESIPADINLEEHLAQQMPKPGENPPKAITRGGKNAPGQTPRPKKDRSHLRVIK
jgi:stringent starvation protein B